MTQSTVSSETTKPTAQILIGDALTHLCSFETATFDSVVTDPPYGIAAHGGMLGQVSANYGERGTHSRGYADNDPARYQQWCTSWLTECLRVLKPGGHMVCFGGPPTIHRLTCAAEDAGFEVRTQLAWIHRPGAARGAFLTDEGGVRTGHASTLTPAFEPFVLLRKPLDQPTLRQNHAVHGTGFLRTTECSVPRLNQQGRPYHPSTVMVEADAIDLTAWHSPFLAPKPAMDERRLVDGTAHPTVKPLDLIRHLVRLVTPAAGRVLDPFAGSGTTLEAALLEELSPTIIEIDPDYMPLIQTRLDRSRSHI